MMDFRSLIPFRTGHVEQTTGSDPFSMLRREMDRMFEDYGRSWQLPPAFSAGNGFLSPRVDIAETESGLELTAELPGIAEKDIHVEIEDGVLTLRAEHSAERTEDDEKRKYHLVERSRGSYLRRFQLPYKAEEDKVEARFDNGVLKVTIPRAAAQGNGGRKIEVKKA